MLLDKFKQGKEIDLVKGIQKYVAKHFESVKFANLEKFVNSISINRAIIINLNNLDKSYESMKSHKEHLVIYLAMLNIIRTKFNFGNDQYSIKLEIGWRDSISNDFYYSNNIFHEYYNVLFNLALMYYFIGKCDNHGDETKIKEQIKYLQYSAYLFDMIKKEIISVIPTNEIQPDLSSEFLTYANLICLANAQILILEIASIKGLAFQLQAQLAKGVYELFTLAYNLSKESSMKKVTNDEVKIFLNNRRFYYLARSFLKRMKESTEENFKLKAEGFAIESLQEGEKDIHKAKNLLNVASYSDFKSQLGSLHQELTQKNINLYFDFIPEAKLLPKIENLIKVSPVQPPDDFNKIVDGQNCLDNVVPKEIKAMVENYKQSIHVLITSAFAKFQTELSIEQFLNSLNLPSSLEACLYMRIDNFKLDEFPESLWNKIIDIQKKGGAMFLTNNFYILDHKNEELLQKILSVEKALFDEAQEDNKNRNLYNFKRWSRKESLELTKGFSTQSYEFKQKLFQSKSCDSLVKEGIIQNMKYFEFLNLTKDQLTKRMPVSSEGNGIRNSEEVKALSNELDILNDLQEKMKECINQIYQNLNEENISSYMIRVLQKKTTEQAVYIFKRKIFNENKKRYEINLIQIEEINNKIVESEIRIKQKNEEFVKIKQIFLKNIYPNEKYFSDLEAYIQLYNQKSNTINQGIEFYKELAFQINLMCQRIYEFIKAREIEKNELIKLCTGQTIIPGNLTSDYIINPNSNLITNINYQYSYQPQTYSNQYQNPNKKNVDFKIYPGGHK